MSKENNAVWYIALERKVTLYKIYKFSLALCAILGAIALYVLSLIYVNKVFMALAFLTMLIYYIISAINYFYDDRIEYDSYDMIIFSVFGILSLMAVLACLNIFPWLQYVLGLLLFLIIYLFSSYSMADVSDIDILDWNNKTSFVDGAVIFGIFLVLMFLFPIKDVIKSMCHNFESEQARYVKSQRKEPKSFKQYSKVEKEVETKKNIDIISQVDITSEVESEQTIEDYIKKSKVEEVNIEQELDINKKAIRPQDDSNEDLLDDDALTTESASREFKTKKHTEDND